MRLELVEDEDEDVEDEDEEVEDEDEEAEEPIKVVAEEVQVEEAVKLTKKKALSRLGRDRSFYDLRSNIKK